MNKLALPIMMLAGVPLFAAVEPVSPVGGETVQLLPDEQRKIMSLPTYDDRLAELKTDKDEKKTYFKDVETKWRVAKPLVLKWRTTGGERGPWKILIGKKADLSDATTYWVEARSVESRKESDGVRFKWMVPRANLELGQTYRWKVWSDIKCREYSHGSTLRGPCACGKGRAASESPVAEFATAGQPPRWIAIEGRVKNIRDLGGWKTRDGRRVKQGMLFRGEGLNDNSVNGDVRGRSRLMVEDIPFLTQTLGIKTDLDLRTPRETCNFPQSPLGAGVTLISRASPAYTGIFADKGALGDSGMKTMAENFRVFCDAKNYPIYFHCIGGADRTGSLAYVLNGILGVDKHDLEVDWESTFYPTLPELEKGYTGPTHWRREQHFNDGFAKYGDKNTSWNERIELYLLDCGITKEEIARFRSIMLEKENNE